MPVKQVTFLKSCTDIQQCPPPRLPEYAFIGRSNVGKSSLINLLAKSSKIAKISSTPGKTQTINFFTVNSAWYLVDLPGYGYARVSKPMVKLFDQMIKGYILQRTSLVCLFVLIDIRLEPQKNDLAFMEWLGQNNTPFAMVFTKSDKVKPVTIAERINNYREKMFENWDQLPEYFVSSAEKGEGREQLLDYIEALNNKVSGSC